MSYFILGIALLVGFLLLARWISTASPKVLSGIVRGLIIVLGLIAILYLYGSGRGAWAAAMVPLLLSTLIRWRAMRRMAKAWRGPSPGRASVARTRFLVMTLDHDTGEMSGEVIEGAFAGRKLADLGLDDLLAFYRECRTADEQSARVLEAYLDRNHGAVWRERAGVGADGGGDRGGGFQTGAMTREEAREILGLKRGASVDEIKAIHRRLMATVHPDRGGSTYLAAKINQAKDVLLNP